MWWIPGFRSPRVRALCVVLALTGTSGCSSEAAYDTLEGAIKGLLQSACHASGDCTAACPTSNPPQRSYGNC